MCVLFHIIHKVGKTSGLNCDWLTHPLLFCSVFLMDQIQWKQQFTCNVITPLCSHIETITTIPPSLPCRVLSGVLLVSIRVEKRHSIGPHLKTGNKKRLYYQILADQMCDAALNLVVQRWKIHRSLKGSQTV